MKIAVTDANIFIDLMELKIVAEFFQLELEVHTTLEVMNELYHDQQEILKAYSSVSKLTIHNLQEEQLLEIKNISFPKSLSHQDKSVIYLAAALNAILLSSDKPVRNYAGREAIEYHGMFWIFDRLIDQKLLSSSKAIQKLRQMMQSNLIYQNNVKLWKEAEKRILKWS